MRLYKRRRNGRGFAKQLDKAIETLLKCGILMLFAAPFSWVASGFWYLALFKNDVHLDPKLEVIATAAWIPIFGIMYGFLANAVITRVLDEYKTMRMAIKSYDFEVFMRLKDEDVSPLVHGLMTILGMGVLSSFMLLAYPDALSGLLVVGSTSYILTFIFIVVREIDDPLAGVWFIKTVHKEWEPVDVKRWREQYYEKQRGVFLASLESEASKATT